MLQNEARVAGKFSGEGRGASSRLVEGQNLNPGCAANRRAEGRRCRPKQVHMRIVGGEDALRHFGEKEQVLIRTFPRGGKRSRPKQPHRPEGRNRDKNVGRRRNRKPDAACGFGKRHAGFSERAPIGDPRRQRKGEFLGCRTARGVPGMAARQERNERRRALTKVEGGVDIIRKWHGPVSGTFARKRESRERIEASRTRKAVRAFRG